jgi:hypothetical protein
MAELSDATNGSLPVVPCCAPEQQADCCAPSEKAQCCPPGGSECGCQASAKA